MGDKTNISWTASADGTPGATWNPIRSATGKGWHCVKISAGCKNCYSAALNQFRGSNLPYSLNADTVVLDEKALLKPYQWTRPRKIFVCSMTDLFGEFVPDEFILRLFKVMAEANWHTYIILTKRAARMAAFCRQMRLSFNGTMIGRGRKQWREHTVYLYPSSVEVENSLQNQRHIWMGVSAEDQPNADQRIPYLLQTPAAIRFVSYEPALGPADFTKYMYTHLSVGLDWLIYGGESGADRRVCDDEWAERVYTDCQVSGTAFFYKQTGAFKPGVVPSRWSGVQRFPESEVQ